MGETPPTNGPEDDRSRLTGRSLRRLLSRQDRRRATGATGPPSHEGTADRSLAPEARPPRVAGPREPTFRANSFPEVTNLICRLPLSTFFHRPEASNLGDLLRLLVRPGPSAIPSLGFSRGGRCVPNAPEVGALFRWSGPFSVLHDSRVVPRR